MLTPLGLRSRNMRPAVILKLCGPEPTPVIFSRSRDDVQQNDSGECHISWHLAHSWLVKSAEGWSGHWCWFGSSAEHVEAKRGFHDWELFYGVRTKSSLVPKDIWDIGWRRGIRRIFVVKLAVRIFWAGKFEYAKAGKTVSQYATKSTRSRLDSPLSVEVVSMYEKGFEFSCDVQQT